MLSFHLPRHPSLLIQGIKYVSEEKAADYDRSQDITLTPRGTQRRFPTAQSRALFTD